MDGIILLACAALLTFAFSLICEMAVLFAKTVYTDWRRRRWL